jgi:hypothetical protein
VLGTWARCILVFIERRGRCAVANRPQLCRRFQTLWRNTRQTLDTPSRTTGNRAGLAGGREPTLTAGCAEFISARLLLQPTKCHRDISTFLPPSIVPSIAASDCLLQSSSMVLRLTRRFFQAEIENLIPRLTHRNRRAKYYLLYDKIDLHPLNK